MQMKALFARLGWIIHEMIQAGTYRCEKSHPRLFSRAASMVLLVSLTLGCTQQRSALLAEEDASQGTLSGATLALNTTSEAPMTPRRAVLITHNDSAFAAKLALVRGAQSTLDLVYYIFSDDYSSSLLASELVEAAKRGVRVRLLVDYFVNYKRLDYFRMLEHYGNAGAGSLQVRFFNRPTDRIILDAAYLTLGCAAVGKEGRYAECADEKFRILEEDLKRFRTENGLHDERVPSNFNSGGSGVFLSALFTQNPGALADSLVAGKELNGNKDREEGAAKKELTPEQRDRSLRMKLQAARVLWKSRSTNPGEFERITANLKIGLVFLLFGPKLNPLYDMISAYFPINRPAEPHEALRDWQHLTQFTHHKLLLADGRRFILGGRNVEDTYHMRKNKLTPHYVFMDSDMEVELEAPSPQLALSFERLWDFRTMTAELSEVGQHAPNDFLLAFSAAQAKCSGGLKTGSAKEDVCVEQVLSSTLPAAERIKEEHERLKKRAAQYAREYKPAEAGERRPLFVLDEQAALYYLENLPFDKDAQAPERLFAAADGRSPESGRYIHNVWLAALRNTCSRAPAESPQEVLIHNAYFLLPSPLLRQLAEMIDGTLDCRHVRITVLTNSPETTDLAIINLAARYSLKAFSEFIAQKRDKNKGASFRYLEYVAHSSGDASSDISLHSKVMIFGPDVFVGSANADVRSYMLDTNNGLFIRNAPSFRNAYLQWVEGLIADPNAVRDETSFFASAALTELLEHDRGAVRGALGSLFGLRDTSAVPQPVVDLIVEMLRKVYDLTTNILAGSRGMRSAEDKYNDTLKLL